MNKVFKENFKKGFTILIIAITLVIILAIMLKYHYEGEKNVPFNVGKLLVISSAEVNVNDEKIKDTIWDIDVNQFNDVYIDIKKVIPNDSYIKKVRIENLNLQDPKVGLISAYMPSSQNDKKFDYNEQFRIKTNLTFNGDEKEDLKELKIGNQGGTILFRILNKNIGNFKSNNEYELKHDGSLLNLINTNIEDIQSDVSFKLVIETNKARYATKINFKVPVADIKAEGVSKYEIDSKDIIFKRE